jgi:hypothetical protein
MRLAELYSHHANRSYRRKEHEGSPSALSVAVLLAGVTTFRIRSRYRAGRFAHTSAGIERMQVRHLRLLVPGSIHCSSVPTKSSRPDIQKTTFFGDPYRISPKKTDLE